MQSPFSWGKSPLIDSHNVLDHIFCMITMIYLRQIRTFLITSIFSNDPLLWRRSNWIAPPQDSRYFSAFKINDNNYRSQCLEKQKRPILCFEAILTVDVPCMCDVRVCAMCGLIWRLCIGENPTIANHFQFMQHRAQSENHVIENRHSLTRKLRMCAREKSEHKKLMISEMATNHGWVAECRLWLCVCDGAVAEENWNCSQRSDSNSQQTTTDCRIEALHWNDSNSFSSIRLLAINDFRRVSTNFFLLLFFFLFLWVSTFTSHV